MKFELKIGVMNHRNYNMDFVFRRTHIDEDTDYSNAMEGYEYFLNDGGWEISVGNMKLNQNILSNDNGFGLEVIEVLKPDNNGIYEKEFELKEVDLIEKCFNYLEVDTYPKCINRFVANIWEKLRNEEITETQAQDLFDNFSDIMVKYSDELNSLI